MIVSNSNIINLLSRRTESTMAALPVIELISYTRRVQSLYKRAARNIESFVADRAVARYYVVCLRARFDKNRNIHDVRVAKQLLCTGEDELFQNTHWYVRQFAQSPGGTCHQRDVTPPDWIVDYWHPLEKAQYPEYFARREERKLEYYQFWKKYLEDAQIDS